MSYPGNATLTREMQDRILSTFKQSLSAAAAGNRQEAKLGCDFILRLDSLFGPARELLERLESGDGPVPTADLASAIGLVSDQAPATPAAAPPPAEDTAVEAAQTQLPDIDDLSDLDLEMGLSDPSPGPPEQSTEPPSPMPPAAEPPSPPTAPPPEAVAESAAPPQAAPEPSAVDELDDLDLGLDEEVDKGPAEPEPVVVTPAAIEPEVAEPQVLDAPDLDELDDLELSVGAAAAPPEAAEAVAEDLGAVTAPAAEPILEEAAADEPLPAEALPAPPETIQPEATQPETTAPEATQPETAVPETAVPETAVTEATEPEAAAEEATPAAPPPESVEIPLGSEPTAQLDSESQQRIEDLLAEGQEAFDSGEYQVAIDSWSRIFLIDIDHAEANRRIEEARKLKAEADRKVEEKFHEGLAHLESGDTGAATASFRAVLEMQSSHLAARTYLEKLEAGEVPVPTELSMAADRETSEASAAGPEPELTDEIDEKPKTRPDRGSKPVGESMVAVKKSPLKSKGFLAVAAVGLLAVLGGGWYLLNNWSSLFPNSAQEEPAPTAADPVARAKGLHDEGKTPIAIAQLRRLPPNSPQYDEAQALIAQWELEQAPTDTGPEGPSPQELARREALVSEASAAAERREFMRTSELLSAAAAVAPLRGPEVQLLARADEQLQELQNFITIFREGEWDLPLRDLWLLHESDPGNRDVTRLLVDSYYNLGLRALQRKDVKVAAERFAEALKLSPDDPELLRLAAFAATYQTRATDLLYRIYVKYHPFR